MHILMGAVFVLGAGFQWYVRHWSPKQIRLVPASGGASRQDFVGNERGLAGANSADHAIDFGLSAALIVNGWFMTSHGHDTSQGQIHLVTGYVMIVGGVLRQVIEHYYEAKFVYYVTLHSFVWVWISAAPSICDELAAARLTGHAIALLFLVIGGVSALITAALIRCSDRFHSPYLAVQSDVVQLEPPRV
jgi:hypothetical protein